MNINARLQGMVEILTESNRRMDPRSNTGTYATGFLPLHPLSLRELALSTPALASEGCISLDLMCGNGGWALMSAVLGYPSYGIDINPILVREAQRNHDEAINCGYIDSDTPCRFIAGNVFAADDYETFIERATRESYSDRHGPRTSTADPYEKLGVEVSDAGIIYCFCWSGGLGFLCEFLDRKAVEDAFFILPNFDPRNQALALEAASAIPGPYQIMKRKRP